MDFSWLSSETGNFTWRFSTIKVIEQTLPFDEMMCVKSATAVSANDVGKQFSTGMHNRKTLGKAIAIFHRLF